MTGNGVGSGNDPIDGEYIVFIKDLCPNGACAHPGVCVCVCVCV